MSEPTTRSRTVLEVKISPGRVIQRWIKWWLLPVAGDHQTRQPVPLLRAAGLVIDGEERSRMGVIQRLVATKPGDR